MRKDLANEDEKLYDNEVINTFSLPNDKYEIEYDQ